MKRIILYEANGFGEKTFKNFLVHDSPYFKILSFNFRAVRELPVHAHDIEGEVSLTVIEGEGEFPGEYGATLPAKAGDVLDSAAIIRDVTARWQKEKELRDRVAALDRRQ